MCLVHETHIECHFPSIHPVYLVWVSNHIYIGQQKGLICKRAAHAKFSFWPLVPLLLIKIREESTHGNVLSPVRIQIVVLRLLSFVILGKQRAFTSKEGSLTFEKIELCFQSLKDYCFPRRGSGWNTDRSAWLKQENKYQKVIWEGPGVRWLISSDRQVTHWLYTSCKLFSLSETHFSHLLSDHYKRMHYIGLLEQNGLDEITHEHINSVPKETQF